MVLIGPHGKPHQPPNRDIRNAITEVAQILSASAKQVDLVNVIMPTDTQYLYLTSLVSLV